MPRFSIVVPAYNVESCLARCLNSLVNQTFGDFEVVCVDDTSHDGTPSILESYRARDARVRVVRNEQNLHLFATRHVGVRETSGEYVLFVDADDELTLDALECLDAQLRSNPVDILQFPMQVLAEPGAEYELSADSWYMHESQPKAVYGSEIVDCICYQQPDDMCMHHRAFREPGIRSGKLCLRLFKLFLEFFDAGGILDSNLLWFGSCLLQFLPECRNLGEQRVGTTLPACEGGGALH